MKVTYNWLKDFVEIKIPAQGLAQEFTMAGLEVVSLEKRDGDFIFEIETTPNRPDCLSVVGIAREIAAITNKKFNVKSLMFNDKNIKHSTLNIKQLTIKIEDKKDCPLYTAKIIRNVKVGPSPAWLRKRLELIGCRSINNIVDITNYILFTYGEPLHAFDLDKLVVPLSRCPVISLNIRRAKPSEEIITLDGVKRILDKEILIISAGCYEKTSQRVNEITTRPAAIAGIMGARDTEVTENTKNILLEAAVFNPVIIRRARRKIGLQTDSSYRFERGIDIETAKSAALVAADLILKFAGGQFVLDKASGVSVIKKRTVDLGVERVNKILGLSITRQKIKGILNALGFVCSTKGKNNFSVRIPAYRQDIKIEIDLIEEIARIFGYSRIPTSIPLVKPQVTIWTPKDFVSLIKNILTGLGLNEVITYSLIDRDLLNDFSLAFANPIEILNPLSQEQAVLRPTIIPSLSRCLSYNLNQKQNYVNIFEVAKIFSLRDQLPKEELVLGIALCGQRSMLLSKGLLKEELGLLHLKGILEVLFERLGIKNYNFNPDNSFEASVLIAKEKVGMMAKLPKNTLNKLDINNETVLVAEIDLEKVFLKVNLNKAFQALPQYPGISRDISFVLKENLSIDTIFKALKEKSNALLRELKVVDIYQGKQIPQGFKGLTISCLYRSDERTLTEEEINPLHSALTTILMERFSAQIR